MKKIFLLFVAYTTINFAQEDNSSKIKIHSTSVGFGGYYTKKYIENGGASFLVDVVFDYKKNLFLVRHLSGAEIGIVGKSTHNFNEIALLYGRELPITKRFFLEGFTGFGYYKQKSKTDFKLTGSDISVPINLKLIFKTGKHFTLGLNNNYSINSLSNNFSSNLVLGYNF